jgi:uncharacterized PurR-regulated membrane protein YhhQ (DUF165 family)
MPTTPFGSDRADCHRQSAGLARICQFLYLANKVRTGGRWLWARTISSTLVGEGVDTVVFIFVAFLGVLPNDLLWTIFISNYIFKVGVEVVFTPVTYQLVNLLKRVENEDYFDRDNFNPLA